MFGKYLNIYIYSKMYTKLNITLQYYDLKQKKYRVDKLRIVYSQEIFEIKLIMLSKL